jgi:hypothetical protein
MRRITIAIALVAVIALVPATAQAKELASARACDDDGCRTITAKSTLRVMAGGAPTSAPATGAPFHRVRMTVRVPGDEDHSYTMVYVREQGLMRFRGEFGDYDWLAATPPARRAFNRLVRGLEPLPAHRLRGVGEQEPTAQVHKVVPAAAAGDDDGGGFPWTLLLIPGGLALAAAGARRVTKSRAARTGAHGPLARQRLS